MEGRTLRLRRIPASSIRAQEGFTLVELLIVILVISILAAIALPAFLDQRRKGQDGTTKQHVRVVAGESVACYVDKDDYDVCDEESELDPTGVLMAASTCAGTTTNPTPPAAGLVCAIGSGDEIGVAGTAKSGNTFIWTQQGSDPASRGCDPAGSGGCPDDGFW